MKQTILITGSLGQLGRALTAQLQDKPEYILILWDVDQLDITDAQAVLDAMERMHPDIVINCAAYTAVDACEEHEDVAFKVNALGARNLAAGAYAVGAKIVHVSTDYVFDGKGNRDKQGNMRPYVEQDLPAPNTAYGRTKLAGEEMVRAQNPRHLILRTAWLYGEGNNFVRTMLKLAQNHDSIRVVDDQYGSPTSAEELAKLIVDLMQKPEYGTFHATCAGECSWYAFACKIFELSGVKVQVNPCTTEEYGSPTPRPAYSVLDNRMARLTGAYAMCPWEQALEVYLRQETAR